MSPKEKALELCQKFGKETLFDKECNGGHTLPLSTAKRMALIAIELIEQENIDNECHNAINGMDEKGNHITNELYWGEVKKEISSL